MAGTEGFSVSSSHINGWFGHHQQEPSPNDTSTSPKPNPNPNPASKKKRNLPGTPGNYIYFITLNPDAEVIALSPKTLMATNRFICEICNKGFQRDQNLQLHRRGHNLPWKLKQRTNKDQVKKKVYICPEKTCVHHDRARALGDLTGIKKHFSRKHGEKKWKCEKCSKKYAVQSDWKAHSKTCGTREYKCDCGTLFSRKDSFITHRAFCDALAEESARLTSVVSANLSFGNNNVHHSNMININNSSSTTSTMANIPHHLTDHILPPGLVASGCGVQDYGPNSHGFQLQDFNINGDQFHKPRLSLWLNQVNNSNIPVDHIQGNSNFYNVPEMVQNMGSASSTTTLFGSSSSSMSSYGNSNHLVGFDNQKSASTTIPNLSLSPLQVGLKEGGANRLYSSSSEKAQNSSSKPIAPMSATALLQKAAQMGSTRSSNNPSFFGSSSSGVMIMSSSSSSSSSSSPSSSVSATTTTTSTATMNFNSLNQNRNVNVANMVDHNHGYLDGSNLSNISSNGLNQLVLMQKSGGTIGKASDQPVLKLINPSSNGIENGLTRDFLGSGSGGEISQRQFLSHSIGSAMGLSQFTGNH
ncbi:TFIIH C1-like domain containing protein [Parasponia andersonii]|uniref:TFIIH C1-like domain containing protein n=1 Tax=Parasponia andersonii TaxID=3476 RepID=A0A2P5D7K3_PARAD|nr:TFIIH C1-like domain containing protein [Parasponia andersonii]